MRGDFSRLVLGGDGSSRVLLQQGRVLLDSDWNESVASLVTAQRRLAADLIGPHGGPAEDLGFQVMPREVDGRRGLLLSPGCYYIDGHRIALAPNPADPHRATSWSEQPFAPWLEPAVLPHPPYLVYLDVWERHVAAVQDSSLHEVALGGPDTTSRARVVWQVRVSPLPGDGDSDVRTTCGDFPLTRWRDELAGHAPLLRAWTRRNRREPDAEPSPGSGYTGAANRLYRVEITGAGPDGQTFVWSRENGSAAAAWTGTDGDRLLVERPRDARGFAPGDWVELASDETELAGVAGTRVLVIAVDDGVLSYDVMSATGAVEQNPARLRHPLVRRWDTGGTGNATDTGAVTIRESEWISLEDGIEIQFADPGEGEPPHTYRVGDYWTIPARVAVSDIDWPVGEGGTPLALPPQGVEHHYAPLAWVDHDNTPTDLRRQFGQLAGCAPR